MFRPLLETYSLYTTHGMYTDIGSHSKAPCGLEKPQPIPSHMFFSLRRSWRPLCCCCCLEVSWDHMLDTS